MEGNYDEMTTEEMRREIMRLQGELSAACACLGDLYKILFHPASGDTWSLVLSKLRHRRFDEGAIALKGDDWARGVERFNERLLKVLPGDAVVVHDASNGLENAQAPLPHDTQED